MRDHQVDLVPSGRPGDVPCVPAVVRLDDVELHLAREGVCQDIAATRGGRGCLRIHDEDGTHYCRVSDRTT
ncbi:hypothetical protein GCM10027521_25930 [Amycolatopsis cihanbeyliensis]